MEQLMDLDGYMWPSLQTLHVITTEQKKRMKVDIFCIRITPYASIMLSRFHKSANKEGLGC